MAFGGSAFIAMSGLKRSIRNVESELPGMLQDIDTINTQLDFPITNLIVNGDFSQGTSGWLASGTSLSIVDGKAVLLNTIQYGNAYKDISTIIGNKYYLSGVLTGTINNYIGIGGIGSSQSYLLSSGTAIVSKIFTATATTHRINISDKATASWATYYADNISCINLTATFGAGNEPTKTEMDELMTYFPNSWFDGVTDLANYKWFMIYLLKRMRTIEARLTAHSI